MVTLRVGKGGLAFWFSALSIAGTIATAGTALLPFIVPSSYKPSESITVWNGTSAHYTLNIMLYVSVVLLAIILVYKIFSYWAVWRGKGTLNEQDIKANEHSFY